MITPIITTLGEFLAVRLPEVATEPRLEYNLQHKYWSIQYKLPDEPGFTCSGSMVLLIKDFGGRKKYPQDGELILLDFASSLTEEQWRGIVDSILDFDYEKNLYYKNYCPEPFQSEFSYTTAADSGHSLLNANGIFKENPYGNYSQAIIDKIDYEAWQSAEEKVFNPLILKHKNQTK